MYNKYTKLLKASCPRLWKFFKKLRYPTAPIPLSLWSLNFLIQRVFRVNGNVPWMVNFTSRVISPQNIEIGENVWISFAASGGCYIQGINGVSIGDNTIFAPNVCIVSANHNSENLAKHIPGKAVQIGKHCWIGANVVILPGVTLGDHVIVGAGSVVTKDFPDRSVIVGVPAHILHKTDQEIDG